MYSYEDRIRAVTLYIKLGKRTGATIRQLGYLAAEGASGESDRASTYWSHALVGKAWALGI